ncbi:MAG: MarR family transcriptional regulator [Azoarcus sp.]|jgi:DNA-binding MarR family transcriptional regulator|nr:MarR family transcriptional regulator [Azoarcus sp.]
MQQKSTFSRLLYRTATSWLTHLEARLHPRDVNVVSWQILRLLHSGDIRYNQHMLASRLGIETSYLARLLDRMEQRDLVERQVDAQDRRQNHIAITLAGLALIEEIDAEVASLRRVVLADIAPADLGSSIRLLEQVLDNAARVLNDEDPQAREIPAKRPGARHAAPNRFSKYDSDRRGHTERRGGADRRGNVDRRDNADRRADVDP